MVPERELVRLGPERESHDLVTEADPEHRHLAEQRGHLGGRAFDGGRVTGTVREEHAVGVAAEHVGRRRRRRHHLDVATDAREVAQDRGLDPVVVGHDVERRVGLPDRVGVRRRDLGDEVDPVGTRRRRGRGPGDRLVGPERARHRTTVTQVTGETPGVDAGDARDAVLPQVGVEISRRPPVARSAGEIPHDDPATEGPAALGVVAG